MVWDIWYDRSSRIWYSGIVNQCDEVNWSMGISTCACQTLWTFISTNCNFVENTSTILYARNLDLRNEVRGWSNGMVNFSCQIITKFFSNKLCMCWANLYRYLSNLRIITGDVIRRVHIYGRHFLNDWSVKDFISFLFFFFIFLKWSLVCDWSLLAMLSRKLKYLLFSGTRNQRDSHIFFPKLFIFLAFNNFHLI